MCVLRHTCHPARCAPRRIQRGKGSKTSTRAFASLGPVCAARGACARETGPSEAMARMDVRLFGCSAVPPLLAAPAAGRLRGGTRVGARVLRDLTRRGCPSGARQRKASSTAHPATDTTQVCPGAKRRGRRLGVAFSLVTFFWRSKRKLLARRAIPGLRPQQRHATQSVHKIHTTKSIATSAYPTSTRAQISPEPQTPTAPPDHTAPPATHRASPSQTPCPGPAPTAASGRTPHPQYSGPDCP